MTQQHSTTEPTPASPDPYEIRYNPESKLFDLLFRGIRFDDAPDYVTADTLCQVHQALEEAEEAEESDFDEDDTGESDQHGYPGGCVPLERFHSWCEAAGEASVRWGLEPAGCPQCDGFHLVLEAPARAERFGAD